MKGQLTVVKATIKGLRRDNKSFGKEITKLQGELPLFKIHMSATNTRLSHAKRRVYEARFEECKTLAMQVLLAIKAHLLQVPIKAQPLAPDLLG